MGLRFMCARGISAALTFGLRHIAHSPALNTPGKIALYADPRLIEHARGRISGKTIVVAGTNGKTTVSNLIPDILAASGMNVACNRSGANLDSGIATVLLQTKHADAGVFECDELWTTKVVPYLKPDYFLLLNLFRDQLDRCGEIDIIQDAIISSLKASPDTVFIYNADDPLCEYIARQLPNRHIAFGLTESMGLAQNAVSDAAMCQACSHMFEYGYRQYGQLGTYICPNCGFTRPQLDFFAKNVRFEPEKVTFDVFTASPENGEGAEGKLAHLEVPFSVGYMVYNILAAFTAARLMGAQITDVQKAIDAFDPHNGRLQRMKVADREVLLNLGKNPTGFNQNLKIIASAAADSAADSPVSAAFFVNDREADGRDVSWLWDIDFEELAGCANRVFAGGTRRLDLAVRLKYAGLEPIIIDDIRDAFVSLTPAESLFVIANYTALPHVKSSLESMAREGVASMSSASDVASASGPASNPASVFDTATPSTVVCDSSCKGQKLVIAHLLPDLLNLYGDGGNVSVLARRAADRGFDVEVRRLNYGDPIKLDDVNIVFLGGAPDREQRLAARVLADARDELAVFVNRGGALLAICGGYQMLGRTWILEGEDVAGLDILPVETRRPGAGSNTDRMVGNIVLTSPLAARPVVGYENHAGRTYLDAGAEPFGCVVSKHGFGNNDTDSQRNDGVVYKNAIGTYLHGPILPKNPEIADWLISRGLEDVDINSAQATVGEGEASKSFALCALDDALEYAANDYMAKRLI